MVIVRNRITLQAAISDCSEPAVQSHPFSNISPENAGGSGPSVSQIIDYLFRVAILY